MDISVSRLNKRMALQLPAEFPLGLVFVVGKVRNLSGANGEGTPQFFYIAEKEHILRCRLSERALEDVTIKEGDMIRAGGHLAFDTLQADYYLLARDVEVLPEQRPSRTMLAPILEDIQKRSQAARLAPAELPDWVQKIAPPELQIDDEPPSEPEDQKDETAEITSEPAVTESTEPADEPSETEALPEGFTDDLVEFLSEAMDSPEEVALTQDMVTELAPAVKKEKTSPRPTQPYDVVHTQTEPRVPWVIVLVVLLFLVSFLGFMLFLAVIAAI